MRRSLTGVDSLRVEKVMVMVTYSLCSIETSEDFRKIQNIVFITPIIDSVFYK